MGDVLKNIFLITLFFGVLYPCSCLEPPPPEDAYLDADVVFSGEVINIVLDDSGYYLAVTFQLVHLWKGEVSNNTIIFTDAESSMCGYDFQINHEYLVYAYSYDWGLYTNNCTRTNLIENALEDLEFLDSLNNQDCEDIEQEYSELHTGEYIECDFDINCMSVWGHCSDGLGECHYSVNASNYPEDEINELVDLWNENECMDWVCDCLDLPASICFDGTCKLSYCDGPTPAGCFQNGCPDGYECIDDPNYCVSSFCYCDEVGGDWICTDDCNGGTCFLMDFLLGDLNFDGTIDVTDIILLVTMILNPDDIYIPEMFLVADVDQDGDINILDVVQIVNIILN